ncbi:hypothetical protein HQ587_09045 [bacterium]|nr:hypothetical protein [bacterium]
MLVEKYKCLLADATSASGVLFFRQTRASDGGLFICLRSVKPSGYATLET